jgi:hypothetical protein
MVGTEIYVAEYKKDFWGDKILTGKIESIHFICSGSWLRPFDLPTFHMPPLDLFCQFIAAGGIQISSPV